MKYGGIDADMTNRLAHLLRARVKERGQWETYKEYYAKGLQCVIHIEYNGASIDSVERDNLEETYPRLMELDMDIITETEYFKKFKEVSGKDEINLNSYKQKMVMLYDIMCLPILGETKAGNKPTDKDTLQKLLELDDIHELRLDKKKVLTAMMSYAQKSTIYSSFVKNLPEKWVAVGTPNFWEELTGESIRHENFFIHPSFHVGMKETGRWSCSEPNLQNIPKESKYPIKNMFKSRFKDGVIIVPDYSQLELRVLAMISKSDKWREIFEAGLDFHTASTSNLLGIPIEEVTSDQRSRMKHVVFGILYGQGPASVAEKCGMSKDEAVNYIKSFYERFPSAKRYQEEQIEYAKANNSIHIPSGKIRYLTEFEDAYRIKNKDKGRFSELIGRGERKAVNTPIQGFASDINQTGLVYLFDMMNEMTLKSKIFGAVHDSIEIDVHPTEIVDILSGIHECLVLRTQEHYKAIRHDIPLSVSYSVGSTWGSVLESKSCEFYDDHVSLKFEGKQDDFISLMGILNKYYEIEYGDVEEIEEEEKIVSEISIFS